MEHISQLLDVVADETGGIAPLLFFFALLSGIVGSFLSRLRFRKGVRDREVDLAIEIIKKSHLSSAENREKYHRLILSIMEAQEKQRSPSKAIARFGEYVSNDSPIDQLTKVSQ